MRLVCKLSLVPFLLCLSLLFYSNAYSATPAGTVIKNQASASYKDSNGILRVTTSNIVETLIQQVAALQLTQDQSRPVAAGNQVFLPHTVTNTGNGTDLFTLTVTNNVAGDDFDLTGLAIYADENQDGQPDIYTPVSQTSAITMQGSWSFVVAGSVPPGTAAGQQSVVTVNAVSQFNNALTSANTDTVVVSDGAVVEVSKSISATAGTTPGGPFTVTLNYRNTGSGDATDVTIIDALPIGMDYVAGSGRWNETGSEVLTDNSSADYQGSPETIRYCAYDATCGGLPEADNDADNDSVNQITGIVSNLASGETGQISFEVEIQSGLNAGDLLNTAEFEYTDNATVSTRFNSNTVSFEILHNTEVVLNGSDIDPVDGTAEPSVVAAVAQGNSVYFNNYVWNSGNGEDSFDISIDKAAASFPPGSVYRVLQSDGMTPLMDSSGNGIPDTGPLPSGEFYKVVVQVVPPASTEGDNGGAGYEVSAMATSVIDSSKTNAMVNRLLTISTAGIDITNVAEIGDGAELGAGAGPETSPVSTLVAAPGSRVIIGLYINNTGQTPVSPDLTVSTVSDFSTIELPAHWRVDFRIEGEDEDVTNTGLIQPGEYTLVNATVTIPANAADGDTSLYFQALSDLTGAVDVKHDVITVTTVEQVLLELDQSGQTDPGGSYAYSHTITNNGNVGIADLQLSTVDSLGPDGWTSVIYEDTDADDALSGTDQVATSIVSLAVGESRRLFVKVFSPSGAPVLSANQTELTVLWNGGAGSASVIDVTTIALMEINIVKEQAPDFGCDGTIDGSYGVTGFAVEPGNNCVSYRLTATNAGQAVAYNVDVADATPAFTEYAGVASCSQSGCAVSEPAIGGQGNIVASIPSLAAGAQLILEFSVRVE